MRLGPPLRLLTAGVLATTSLAAALIPWPAGLVEPVYSRGLYPWIQRGLTPISNITTWALFDIALALILGMLVWRAVKHVRRQRLVAALGSWVVDLAIVASTVYLWFFLAWGLNYRRQPIEERVDFDSARVDQGAMARLARQAVSEVNRLYDEAHRQPWLDVDGLGDALYPSFVASRSATGDSWRPTIGRAKRSLLEMYFRRAGVDGMTNPFFLEVILNHDVLPFERPFVLSHEWAHLAGHADEAEASFVAWMTCVRAGAPSRYSAWLSVYPTFARHLPREERAAVAKLLQRGPRRDLQAVRERLERTVPVVREAAWRAYDRYLKANRVDEGTASYDRVARLIAGTKLKVPEP